MALQVADHAYVLESGKIALSGTGEELAATDAIKKPTSAAEIKQKLLCQIMSDRAIFIFLYVCLTEFAPPQRQWGFKDFYRYSPE